MPAATTDRPFAIVVCFEDASRERFLLARHEDRGWEIPGGRIEADETPLEAAVREFREETGHDVLDAELVLEQQTPEGVCHVATGRWGPPVEDGPSEDDAIERWRFVSSLDEVEPLAFPDDPYEEIEAALGIELRGADPIEEGPP